MNALTRAMQAEVIAMDISWRVQMSRYTWSGIGDAPWVRRMLRRYAGQADIRSVQVNWASVVRMLRANGYTGGLPRSFRRYE